MARKKICCHPGCDLLIDVSETYCPQHQVTRKPFENATRANQHLYNTTRWRKLRREVLTRQNTCVKCGITNAELALDIHHVIPPRGNEELFFDVDNCVPVCKSCHRVLTSSEARARKDYASASLQELIFII